MSVMVRLTDRVKFLKSLQLVCPRPGKQPVASDGDALRLLQQLFNCFPHGMVLLIPFKSNRSVSVEGHLEKVIRIPSRCRIDTGLWSITLPVADGCQNRSGGFAQTVTSRNTQPSLLSCMPL